MIPTLYGLTQPRNDTSVLRAVLNQHLRTLVHDALSLPVSSPLHLDVVALLRRLIDRNPQAAVRVLREPVIACLVGCLRRRGVVKDASVEPLLRELDLLLLTELTAGDLLEIAIEVAPDNRPWPALRSLSTRTVWTPPAGRALRFESGKALPGDPAYQPIVGTILFATSDNNPLLSLQAHPDRPGNRVELGAHAAEEWLTSLREAFALIARYQPLIFEEMKLALTLIIPVGYDSEKHFSVSFEEAIGTIYMTLHPNVMTVAEALIHEFQHNKLNAVFRWDPVLQNAWSPLYSSPVRPDPRPLHGVLMAVHAFQPVAKLYEAMTDAGDPITKGRDWLKRFRQIIDINHEGAETVLSNGRPTAAGEGLLREMRELDEHYGLYGAKLQNPVS